MDWKFKKNILPLVSMLYAIFSDSKSVRLSIYWCLADTIWLDMGVTPVLKIRLTWDFSDSLFHSRKNNFQLTWKFSHSLFRLEWL